jgi:hypothetical protein
MARMERWFEPLTTFLDERVAGSYFCQGEYYSRIGHHSVLPAFGCCFAEKLEIVLSHLHVDLYGSFHTPCIRQFVLDDNVTKSTHRTRAVRPPWYWESYN